MTRRKLLKFLSLLPLGVGAFGYFNFPNKEDPEAHVLPPDMRGLPEWVQEWVKVQRRLTTLQLYRAGLLSPYKVAKKINSLTI